MKQFNSIFKDDIVSIINYKRSLGLKYEAEELAFSRLDKFLTKEGLIEKKISKDIFDKWACKTSWENENNRNHRVSNFRVLAKELNNMGYEVYIPPIGLFRTPPKYRAHIYTDNELKKFFEAVDRSKNVPEAPYRSMIMPVFFRILYTSGLRVSELRQLKVNDMHEDEEYIVVRNAKNSKDRIVPIHPELANKCHIIRNEIHANSSDDEYFFITDHGKQITLSNVYKNFRRYLERAGISHTGKGPRVHDFRHTYCVNLLKKWMEEEKDLLNYLPYMSEMLGHEGFDETAYYLRLTTDMFPKLSMKIDDTFGKMINLEDHNDEDYY